MNFHRHSIRLNNYDYSSKGAYYITICTCNNECIFGDIIDDEMKLNRFGIIVRNEWIKTEKIRRKIILDDFIVMPNHLHGIVFIVGATGRSTRPYVG